MKQTNLVEKGKNGEFFSVNVCKYVPQKDFNVVRPASLDHPKNNAVMFIMERYYDRINVFDLVENCLIYWPSKYNIPDNILERHAVVPVENPHKAYCTFFKENNIQHLEQPGEYQVVNGAYIENGAVIGDNCTIYPGAYIGKNVVMGNHVYIASGVKLRGDINVGNNVVIRENTVIGADGLSTDRDELGRAVTMPQFGGVSIEDDVQIGANTVIARGAIDDTVICRGVKIDNSTFISHNVHIGADSFIVGETIMFGSSSTGERVLISGNSLIANYVHIGSDTILGQTSTAIKSIPENVIAFGSPAKVIRKRGMD